MNDEIGFVVLEADMGSPTSKLKSKLSIDFNDHGLWCRKQFI